MSTTPGAAPLSAKASLVVERYGAVSIALHWTIAALILIQIGMGLYMNHVVEDHSPTQDSIQLIHVSLGLTTLVLVVVRIVWRLTHPSPLLPVGLPAWERTLARATQVLFYVLMLALPLTGWALLSVRPEDILFWGAHWPRLPGLTPEPGRHGGPIGHTLQDLHTNWLWWLIAANLVLHVAGALKHQFDGNPVLWRMSPFGGPRSRIEPPR